MLTLHCVQIQGAKKVEKIPFFLQKAEALKKWILCRISMRNFLCTQLVLHFTLGGAYAMLNLTKVPGGTAGG